jgi:hypothetical protein
MYFYLDVRLAPYIHIYMYIYTHIYIYIYRSLYDVTAVPVHEVL